MMLSFVPVVLAFQVSVQIGGKPASADSSAARRATLEAIMEEVRSDTGRRRDSGRRTPVTSQHLATAFKDEIARTLLERARIARLRQDSSLVSYDAKAYERVSVKMGVKLLGRERLAFRHEDAARVRWHRARGVWVEVTGSRTVIPMADGADNNSDGEVTELAPVPYFPGRDNLWVGSGGLARAEVNENEIVHPLGIGAEAYYTYETGDSVQMTLPDGQRLTLREMRIVSREPKWNVIVGSFWFDVASAQLVRAVYRLSTPMDIWAMASEESARERADTTRIRREVRNGQVVENRNRDDGPPGWVKGLVSPMKADVSGITIEYGLYNQRFWLPRSQAVEGFAQASFMRVPMSYEQRFSYESVNGLDSAAVPKVPPPQRSRVAVLRDSLRAAGVDSVLRDSLVRAARRERIKELEAERLNECAKTGLRTRYRTEYNGALRMGVQVPCDSAKLANSPDLPKSIYDEGDELFGKSEREELMKALSFGLQPGWGPQMPVLEYGFVQTRYNRVEGLSTGITATSALGKGYSASIGARGSYADRQLNGELAGWRSNGRTTWRAAAYRRLQASNDWGNPLSFGSSLSSLLYGRDEGAYYRAWGGELTITSLEPGKLEWRLFGEQQWGDSVRSRWTLFGGGNDTRFIPNPMAKRVTHAGVALRKRSQWGLNPNGFRAMTDLRTEVAGGDSTYVRGIADITFTGPIGRTVGALTLSGGASQGAVPPQRQFYLGGTQSVRGQTALTAAGNTFWLARGELGTRTAAARTVLFGDLGWAGRREDFSKPGRPLAGVGIGWSFLDGLIRADLARGLYPTKQWRFDIHLDAKF